MNVLITFFAAIGMSVVVISFLSLILWIAIKIEDRKRGIRKPPSQTVKRPEAPILGTQIRPIGSEPDYSQNIRDWWPK